MALRQRISLRQHTDDIRHWVAEGRTDEWIANALGTSPSSVQSFRSRNGVYRKAGGSAPPTPEHYSAYEGVVESGGAIWFDPQVADDETYRSEWESAEKVKLHITPSRIVVSRR